MKTPRAVRFDEHMAKRGRVIPESIQEVKEWRTKEAAAGRPSEFSDYCRLRGLCAACNAEGLVLNENGIGFKLVGLDGNMPLHEPCPVCGGTGKIKPT
jgi:hypothetical protein